MTEYVSVPATLLRKVLEDHRYTQYGLEGQEWEVCATCHERQPGSHLYGCVARQLRSILAEHDRRSPKAVEPYDVEIGGKTRRVVSVSYTTRGRVPVKTEFFKDGGCSPLAYNPMLGGFVRDTRYYPSPREDDQDITKDEYDRLVATLRDTWGKKG